MKKIPVLNSMKKTRDTRFLKNYTLNYTNTEGGEKIYETVSNFDYDNPTQLGSDLVVTAVAAIAAYPVPSIIIDMGTATTFSVINDKRQYIGGAIAPGAAVALNSLSSQTSQLPFISLEAPKHVIGSNTIDCMKSGSLFGNAAMIDGMIRRIKKEIGENAIVVATGGIAPAILTYCEESISYDPDLMLKGLALIYKKNQTR